MLIRPSECRGCPLDSIATGFSHPTGSGSLGVMVVAEALGRHEAEQSRPLVEWADAGSMFQRALDKAGFDREQFVLWNVVACRPPNNKLEHMPYERGAVEHCRVHFNRVLQEYRPRAIFAMGNTALKHLTGMTGKNRTVSSLRGYVLRGIENVSGIPVIPSYHPSFLRRGATNLFRVYMEDLKRSVKVALGEDTNYDFDPKPERGWILNPTESDVRDLLEELRSHPELLLAYDIETDNSLDIDESELFKFDSEEGEEEQDEQEKEELEKDVAKALAGPIVQIQFATSKERAISIPWIGRFIPGIREILATANRKIGHNAWRFDDRMLTVSGVQVNGPRIDSLWMFHHSQPDLPAHLQFVASFFGQRVPWKHLSGADLALYGAFDVAVLQGIAEGLPGAMEQIRDEGWRDFASPFPIEIRSVKEGYERMVQDLNPILEKMSRRGIPVDKEGLDEFEKEVQGYKDGTYEELSNLYPIELLPPKQANGLKKAPKEVEELVKTIFGEQYTAGGGVEELYKRYEGEVWEKLGYLQRDFEDDLPIYRTVEEFCSCKLGQYKKEMEGPPKQEGDYFPPTRAKGCKKCEKTGIIRKREVEKTIRGWERRWYQPRPFKPSSTQISNYIQFRKHKQPTRATMKKEATGKREKATTDKTALAQLFKSTKDPFYDLVVKYRNYEKLITTYVRGWQPKADGRVHSSFLFRPATGQLSSVGPNVQNSPGEKGGDLSVRFKDCIRARPGRTLVELDWSGLHAFMLGFLAGDPQYMRLSRLGIHDYLAAHILKGMIERDGLEKAAKNYALLVDPKNPIPDDVLMVHSWDQVYNADEWLSFDDEHLGACLSWVKNKHKVFRSKIKPAVHGYGFGLGAFKLFKGYPDNFSSIKDAQAVLDMLNNLFPIVARYREEIKEKADREGKLVSPFGAVRYFHDVFDRRPVAPDYSPKWGEKLVRKNGRTYKEVGGMDAEKAIAFLPANCSFGYVKDAMLEMERRGMNDRYHLINQVHDSVLFECEDELVDECVEKVLEVMQAPSPCLVSSLAPEGLRCYAAASIGKTWGRMKEL